MGLSQNELLDIADKLDKAEATCTPIESLVDTYPGMEEKDAYQIQWIIASRALRAQRHLVGYKIGLTSLEAQKHFQVYEPDYGHLFDSMVINEEGEIDLSQLIQPKIEGEIAFVLGRDLRGPGITPFQVARAVEFVTTSFEIIDSRIKNWKITSKDTIADNGSSARFILAGQKEKLEGLNLAHLGLALYKNNDVVVTGSGAAVMGNPLNAVAFLANTLAKHDRFLMEGQVILSGSIGGMVSMQAGDHFSVEIQSLGRVSTRCKGK
ncbi:MAG: fumarylacetoacetate hydrolase family protein [Proteobacteria bacterium]|nr:fumarylacetoacetate hydrolase family protein [Pseudomonadota bacterium]